MPSNNPTPHNSEPSQWFGKNVAIHLVSAKDNAYLIQRIHGKHSLTLTLYRDEIFELRELIDKALGTPLKEALLMAHVLIMQGNDCTLTQEEVLTKIRKALKQ